MVTIVCSIQECRTAVRIQGEDGEMESLFGEGSEWYPDNFPCPRCKAPSSIIDSISPAALKELTLTDVSAGEAYAAFNGLGLPEEHDCGPTAVADLLLKQRIVKADVGLIRGANRSVLRSLEFEDGTKMYLGSSPYGSTVFRLAPKRSIVEEVLSEP